MIDKIVEWLSIFLGIGLLLIGLFLFYITNKFIDYISGLDHD